MLIMALSGGAVDTIPGSIDLVPGPQGHWRRRRSRDGQLDHLFARWPRSDVSLNRVRSLGEAQAGPHPDGAPGFSATGSHRNDHWITRTNRCGRAIASHYGG